MVAKLSSVHMQSVHIGPPAAVIPVFPTGINVVTTLGSMMYEAAYLTAFPAITATGGTFDPTQTGTAGTLSAGNTNVVFSAIGATRSTISFTDAPKVWEFQIGSAQFYKLGFSGAFGGPPFNKNDGNGGDGGGAAGQTWCSSAGTKVSYGVAGTQTCPTFTTGDVIGIVFNSHALNFFKNGVAYSTTGLTDVGTGYIFASRYA